MFRNYANFSGMTSRKNYWQAVILHCFCLFLPVIPLILTAPAYEAGTSNRFIILLTLMLVYRVLTFLPVWAITVRRLHDVPMSGWLLLVLLIPMIGSIIILINLLRKGKGLEEKRKFFELNPILKKIYERPRKGGWIWLPILLIAAAGFLFWKEESVHSFYLESAKFAAFFFSEYSDMIPDTLKVQTSQLESTFKEQTETIFGSKTFETKIPSKTSTVDRMPTAVETPSLTVEAVSHIPGDRVRSKKDDAVIILIPAGEFQTGDEAGFITLEEYWIDRTEVTNEQYQSCVADGFCSEPEIQRSSTVADYYTDIDYAAFPVINVSFAQADTYCQWAGRRLPSGAEWENAAKNEKADPFPWGKTFSGNKLNSSESDKRDTVSVGSYPNGKSRFSVHDMSGNVWEWVNTKTIRGGGWNSYETTVQVTSEQEASDEYFANNLGFRCALANVDFDPSAYSGLSAEELAEDHESPPDIGSERERSTDGMIEMYIPSGEFTMGNPQGEINEKPAHTVYLDAYWMDKTEVSNSQYTTCVGAEACSEPVSMKSLKRPDYYINEEYADYPMINVSWQQAADYCTWIEGRLPTEAEWEKAARGPDGFLYPWGSEFIDQNLNYSGSGINDTQPVTDYPSGASVYGILNMSGNIAEWVFDRYAENWYSVAAPSENPTGPDTGTFRILRGGSWQTSQVTTQTVYRYPSNPDGAGLDRGFRCVRPE